MGRLFLSLLMRHPVENRFVYEKFERYANEDATVPPLRFRSSRGFRLPLGQTGDIAIVYAMNGRGMLNGRSAFPGVQYAGMSPDGRVFGLARSVLRRFTLQRQRPNRLQYDENVGVYWRELMIAHMMFLRKRGLFGKYDVDRRFLRRLWELLSVTFLSGDVRQGRVRPVRGLRLPLMEQ